MAEVDQKHLIKLINQLKLEIETLKKPKKYGLIWGDKPENVVVECQESVPVLKEVKTRKITSDHSLPINLLIEGDNYHSLSVLNYTHKNKIDVIYIDPPYNTGATDWKYNNDYIDKEDQWKHTKWISFMSRRLKLAKNLLTNTGVLICAIDDNEFASLNLLLDEIFPEKIKNTVVIVNNPHGVSRSGFSRTHEYAVFLLNPGQVINKKPAPEDTRNINLRRSGNNSLRKDSPTMFYPIYVDKKTFKVSGTGIMPKDDFHPAAPVIDNGKYYEVWPIDSKGVEKNWYYSQKRVEEKGSNELNCRIIKNQLQISFHHSNNAEQTYKTVWADSSYDSGTHGATLVKDITLNSFPFPKSINTVLDCLKAVIKSDTATVLDFFAGSGTTGHAVLQLNKEDGGKRKFILCTNNENKIAEEITYERVKRVMNGYKNPKLDMEIEGLGGNLSYYKTDLVNINKLRKISDESKIRMTYQAGEMIAIREDTLNEKSKNEWWQIFEGNGKITAIYFKEDKIKIRELLRIIQEMDTKAVLYIFGWGKNEYKNEYSAKNIRIEDIPEPILEVYKEINRL